MGFNNLVATPMESFPRTQTGDTLETIQAAIRLFKKAAGNSSIEKIQEGVRLIQEGSGTLDERIAQAMMLIRVQDEKSRLSAKDQLEAFAKDSTPVTPDDLRSSVSIYPETRVYEAGSVTNDTKEQLKILGNLDVFEQRMLADTIRKIQEKRTNMDISHLPVDPLTRLAQRYEGVVDNLYMDQSVTLSMKEEELQAIFTDDEIALAQQGRLVIEAPVIEKLSAQTQSIKEKQGWVIQNPQITISIVRRPDGTLALEISLKASGFGRENEKKEMTGYNTVEVVSHAVDILPDPKNREIFATNTRNLIVLLSGIIGENRIDVDFNPMLAEGKEGIKILLQTISQKRPDLFQAHLEEIMRQIQISQMSLLPYQMIV